jgi:hypothetical protein
VFFSSSDILSRKSISEVSKILVGNDINLQTYINFLKNLVLLMSKKTGKVVISN